MITVQKNRTDITEKEQFSIRSTIPYAELSPEIGKHTEEMQKILQQKIRSEYPEASPEEIRHNLPLVFVKMPDSAPGCIEFSILCVALKESSPEEKLENIFRDGLNLGKQIPVISRSSLSFQWDAFPTERFFFLDIRGLLENQSDLNNISVELPSFLTQLRSVLKNSHGLKNFFSNRVLLQEAKQTRIYRRLVTLSEKFPKLFSKDLFAEMGKFFVFAEKTFFEPRDPGHVAKIIALHCLMRPRLSRMLALYPEKRHMEVRFVSGRLRFYFGSKPILGLIIGISPLDNHEFFEESHITQAVQSLLPHINTIKTSFYSFQKLQDPTATLYIELEKKDGSFFTKQEIFLLKRDLAEELKRRIEKLVPSVFMTRNEEEVMRSILLLSRELRYLSDMPQVIISLDSQTVSEITFTVILVRIVRPEGIPLRKMFEERPCTAKFTQDRTQQVGFLRKNHPKEANVFHLTIRKDSSLLRADYSVNFYLARNKIASILAETIGPFRDYNGGMILKQGELFHRFLDKFPEISQKNPELLENFFFSISPIEAQATLALSSLVTLFRQFLKAKQFEPKQKEEYFLRIEENEETVFAMIRIRGEHFQEDLFAAFGERDLLPRSVLHTSVSLQGSLYLGLIFSHAEEKKRQIFIDTVHKAPDAWVQKIENRQVLKLGFFGLPTSMDPRLAGEKSANLLGKMLFEGLTRLNEKGIPVPAVAESIEISPDGKRYVFRFRDSYWSNGDPVTARDFASAWKKVISPDSFSPFVYVFYPIKNVKAIKEGILPPDQAGISSPDDSTLIVELEYPTPDFLELLAHSLYSPVHRIIDTLHPNWASKGSEDFVCNGPFMPKTVIGDNRLELIRNPKYWDKEQVRLQRISVSKNSSFTTNEMFQKGEVHWLGASMTPWEFYFETNEGDHIDSTYIGIYWCVFNTEKFPFHNTKLRRALSLALDKNELASLVNNNCLPACSPLPLSHTMNYDPANAKSREEQALLLFEEALGELGLHRKSFPPITLSFLDTPDRKKTFEYIRDRWKALFDIPCRFEMLDFPTLFSKTTKGDFQVSGTYWKTWIDNPEYILEIFKYNQLDINVAKWFNPSYREFLHQAQQVTEPGQRIKYLSKAEKVLIEEVPVIPLLYEKERNVKQPYLHGVVHLKTTGLIDFKYAYIDKNKEK